jgi:undecaprenyl-diphosphatase
MKELLKLDEQFFLWLNGFHAPWLDPTMASITKTQFWIPLYLILIYWLIKDYKKASWVAILGLVVVIAIADQTTASLMKPYFERLRPSHEPALSGLVHIVENHKGGLYGFASSHAANTFGVAMFMWLMLRKNTKYSWVLFGWACLMSYSRIYLGLHYPGDIMVGALIGLLTGWCVAKLVEKLLRKIAPPLLTQ